VSLLLTIVDIFKLGAVDRHSCPFTILIFGNFILLNLGPGEPFGNNADSCGFKLNSHSKYKKAVYQERGKD
jgi:hypothetical protein